jgi:hypothetical protein
VSVRNILGKCIKKHLSHLVFDLSLGLGLACPLDSDVSRAPVCDRGKTSRSNSAGFKLDCQLLHFFVEIDHDHDRTTTIRAKRKR